MCASYLRPPNCSTRKVLPFCPRSKPRCFPAAALRNPRYSLNVFFRGNRMAPTPAHHLAVHTLSHDDPGQPRPSLPHLQPQGSHLMRGSRRSRSRMPFKDQSPHSVPDEMGKSRVIQSRRIQEKHMEAKLQVAAVVVYGLELVAAPIVVGIIVAPGAECRHMPHQEQQTTAAISTTELFPQPSFMRLLESPQLQYAASSPGLRSLRPQL